MPSTEICGVNGNGSLIYDKTETINILGDNDIIVDLSESANQKNYQLSLYKYPEISISVSPDVVEVGTTVPTSTFSGSIVQRSKPIASRQLNPVVGTLDPLTVNNFTFDILGLQSDIGGTFGTHELTVTDDIGRSVDTEVGVKFHYQYYNGFSSLDALTATQIKGLTNSGLAASIYSDYGGLQTYTIPSTGFQQYIYWAYPEGTPLVNIIRLGLLTFPTTDLGLVSVESDVKPGLFTNYRLLRSANKYSAGSIDLNMVLPDDVSIISSGETSGSSGNDVDGGENGEPYFIPQEGPDGGEN